SHSTVTLQSTTQATGPSHLFESYNDSRLRSIAYSCISCVPPLERACPASAPCLAAISLRRRTFGALAPRTLQPCSVRRSGTFSVRGLLPTLGTSLGLRVGSLSKDVRSSSVLEMCPRPVAISGAGPC